MCKGNGRPRMHVREKVGLSIDYWREKRIPGGDEDEKDGNEEIWRVLVEVEEIPSDFNMNPITPVRTSDHWVSDEIKKPILFGESEDMVTDWLEPPLEGILDMTDTNPRPSPARFIARLDPPVVVPFKDEMQLFNGLMLSLPPGLSVGTLQAKLFPDSPSATGVQRRLYVPNNGMEEEEGIRHEYKLHSIKPIPARQISEIPFSHPKELAGVFSILRQFAHVSALLKSCFSPVAGIIPKTEDSVVAAPLGDKEMDLDAFLADGNDMADGVAQPVPVDISATEGQSGEFTLGVIFPQRTGQGVVGCSFEVGRNADIRVTELSADDGKLGLDANGLEWALAIGSDLGIVVEWLRRRS
ncbi:mediator of RNA polymerase II transcription subunit 1-domain-containing protein [Tuber indicum]|nr:mediator of RNA polymerase II transcription subunit 1-domain-containing protein [Tuber indicum]